MPTATVLVQGKADPERGKKRGRIKSDSGMIFQAIPELLEKVKVGSSYQLEYKDEVFGEAKYRVVEHVYPIAGSTQPKSFASGLSGETKYVPQSEANYSRDELIFVEAFGKEWMKGVTIGDTEAVRSQVVNCLRTVWRQTFGSTKSKIETGNIRDDLADEIPGF